MEAICKCNYANQTINHGAMHTRVANPEAAGLDAADGSGANNGDALLMGHLDELARPVLGDTLGNDGDHLHRYLR